MSDAPHTADRPGTEPLPLPGFRKPAYLMIGAGLLFCLIGLFFGGGIDRLGFGWLFGASFVWAIVLGSLFFVALQHVTHALWSVPLRRVAEMFAAPMGAVALLFVPVVLFALFGGSGLYPWTDPDHHLPAGKESYLNVPFFILRTVVYFLLWIGFAAFFVRRSVKQDAGIDASSTLRMRKVSAPFMLIYALTVTFASFDWFMSLDPAWFSTILGVYVFAGMTASALAAITITAVWLRRRGNLGGGIVTGDHLYSLGALIFAFTCFWAYIAFSQFMLIWYANIPEETVWFKHRAEGGWLTVSIALVFLRFAIPFLLLLARDAKMNPRRLVITSVIVLIGQAVDLYWLILPEFHESGPGLGLHELGPLLVALGILVLCVTRFLARHRTVAVGDPMLEKSIEFHL